MKYVFTYLLLLVGLVSASASPIYAWESVNRSQMQSQRIMRSGVTYSGTIYTPFDNTSPSEQYMYGNSETPKKRPVNPKTFIGGPETGQGPCPVGEPWLLAAFALLFAGVIWMRRRVRISGKTNSTK